MTDKKTLRKELRAERKAHVAALDSRIKALLFKQPPAAILELVPAGSTIGLYRETADEAPASAYARWFAENGHTIALPRFADEQAPMEFAEWADPFGEGDLRAGPFGLEQPSGDAPSVTPDILFVPLVGFAANGARLGQGGGHYDRWLTAHSDTLTIGLAWDVQLRETLPMEAHDVAVDTVVTPTRVYGADL